jgi:2-isopropylmalate synthase
MDAARKRRMFDMLLKIGFKEIEVGFPAASQTDFDFVREIIEQRLIPDDVTIQVLTQARPELIARTYESLKGAARDRACIQLHLRRAASRGIPYRPRGRHRHRGARCNGLVREHAERDRGTEWVFQYSPESFTGTELDFAVEICDAVNAVWEPTPSADPSSICRRRSRWRRPNIYADQIEWFARHVGQRDSRNSERASPQRPRHRRGGGGTRRDGGGGARRGHLVRQRRAHRQRRYSDIGP